MFRSLGIMGIFDVFDSIVDVIGDVFDSIADAIGNAILDAIKEGLGIACYYLTWAWCDIIKAAYAVFAVFAGISKVQMKEDFTYLTNLFFENEAINGIYWGMVMIGAVLAVVFTIIAVVRKMFDINDKQQQSLGQIIGGMLKSLFVMVMLTAVMSVTMTFTNVLIERVSYVFDQNKALTQKQEIEFTDEDRAVMFDILTTIDEYSMNATYNHRYNLNTCYNEIRPKLLYLQDKGIFDLVYPTRDEEQKPIHTWQSELERLVYAANPENELSMDLYYPETSQALTDIMDILRTDASFRALKSYKNEYTSADSASLDRVVFLMGTMNAAKNDNFNKNPSVSDGLRGAFYTGEKSIYSFSDVKSAFRYQLGGISYFMIWFVGYWVLKNLYRCILNCCTRLVNIVGLYVIAPPLAATMSLDDGRRFKEWTTSMIIQMFGVFGNIIPMRLVILFVPMVMDSNLILLPSATLNVVAKGLLITGMMEGVSRFSGILTGILANNAGFAAIQASNTNDLADRQFGRHFGKHFGGEDPDDPLGEKKQAKKDREKDKKEAAKKEKAAKLAQKVGAGVAGAAGAAAAGAVAKKAENNNNNNNNNSNGLPDNQQKDNNNNNTTTDNTNQNGTNTANNTEDNNTNGVLPSNQQGNGNENQTESTTSLNNENGTNVEGEQPLPQSQQDYGLGTNADGEAYVGKDDMGNAFTESERQSMLKGLGKNERGEQYVGRAENGKKYTEAENDAYKKGHDGKGLGGVYYGKDAVGADQSKPAPAPSKPAQPKGGNQGGNGGNVAGGGNQGGNVGGGNQGGNVGGGNQGGNVGGGNRGGNVGGGNQGGGNAVPANNNAVPANNNAVPANNNAVPANNNAVPANNNAVPANNGNVQASNAAVDVPKKKSPPKRIYDPLSNPKPLPGNQNKK